MPTQEEFDKLRQDFIDYKKQTQAWYEEMLGAGVTPPMVEKLKDEIIALKLEIAARDAAAGPPSDPT